MAYAVAILIVLVGAILSPFATIWALNTLFHLGISDGWDSYFAVLWLSMLLASPAVKSNSN
jgi:hypothetical protein